MTVDVQVDPAPVGHGPITAEVFVEERSDTPTIGVLSLPEVEQVILGLNELVRAAQGTGFER